MTAVTTDVEQHDYTHRASQTENFCTTVLAGGNVQMAALGGDQTLAGSTVAAEKSATLMTTGNVNLNAVTDSQSSYTRTVRQGLLNRTTTTLSESSTDQVGSTVAANDNVTLQVGGKFTENAMKDTANAFYEQKSSGLFLGTSGASARRPILTPIPRSAGTSARSRRSQQPEHHSERTGHDRNIQKLIDFQVDPHLLRRGLIENDYEDRPVTSQHAVAVGQLPDVHSDSFDRIVVAQATVEDLLFLTHNPFVQAYPGLIRAI